MLFPRSFTLKHCKRYSLTEFWWCGDEGGRGEEGQVGVRRGVTTYWGGGGRGGWEGVPSGVKIPLFHMGFTHIA
jgi:hypothetical protein